ncbi:MAG: NUDIX domain-containing protein [Candidatus Izemoplasmatales bacterium]
MTRKISEDELLFLEQYDEKHYKKPSVTVDISVFSVLDIDSKNYRKLPEKELKILLIKRKEHPYKNDWALPGGFVHIDESLEDAAYRELKEETNLDNLYLEQLFTWGAVDRDPRTRVISSSYMALINGENVRIIAGTDSEDARWFSIKTRIIKENQVMNDEGYILEKQIEIILSNHDIYLNAELKITKEMLSGKISMKREIVSSSGLAFDHAKIIHYSLERLRAKVEYSDIVFNLMSNEFTLTELQNVYEVILDTKLLAANFRRKITKFVDETVYTTSRAGHRPAKLFQYKNQDEYDFY